MIYDPVAGLSMQVSDIKEDFSVLAFDGVKIVTAKAEAPFVKPEIKPIYRVEINNGKWFTASGDHLVLASLYISGRGFIKKRYVMLSRLKQGMKLVGDGIISKIEYIRDDVQYDLTVPRFHNYYAGGAFHHNSGKTTIGIIIALSTCFGKWPWDNSPLKFMHTMPRRIRIIGDDWENHIKTVIVPVMWEWWPKSRALEPPKKNNAGVEHYWIDIETGSTIEIMSGRQAASSFAGWNGDLVYYDEPCPRDVRVECARGLVDRQGREMFGATLVEQPWIDKEIIRAKLPNGKPDPTIYNVQVSSYENVGYGITTEGLDQYMKTLTREGEKEARIDGKPMYLTGLVYGDFQAAYREAGGHLVKRFQIPKTWPVDIAIDVHPRTEQAVLFVATDPMGFKFACDEIWGHGSPDWLADQIARRVNLQQYRVNNVLIDPLSKGDQNNDFTVFQKIATGLARYNIPLRTATKDLYGGILEVKTALKGPNQMPSLFFFDDLKRTISEIEGYVWDKKNPGHVLDENDHMMENLYRICLLNTKYSEPEDEAYEAYEAERNRKRAGRKADATGY